MRLGRIAKRLAAEREKKVHTAKAAGLWKGGAEQHAVDEISLREHANSSLIHQRHANRGGFHLARAMKGHT